MKQYIPFKKHSKWETQNYKYYGRINGIWFGIGKFQFLSQNLNIPVPFLNKYFYFMNYDQNALN